MNLKDNDINNQIIENKINEKEEMYYYVIDSKNIMNIEEENNINPLMKIIQNILEYHQMK